MPSAPWRPSRPTTILIGLLTVWPLVYICLFLAFIATSFLSASSGPAGGPGASPTWVVSFFILVGLHILTMLLMVALMTIYIVHVFRTDRIAENRKVLWVVVLLFGGIVAAPIYWYLFLWKRDEAPGEASAPF